ncbi:MAG: hypothetical protein JW889_10610 [Verrucomicrobia bacterium]|nr:hypothetical protein [Verrucomicrobiota bacterium]
MLRGDVVYLDNNAWQKLSANKHDILLIEELGRSCCLHVALSRPNLYELPLRRDESQTERRVQMAETMMAVASREHFLKDKIEIAGDEIRVALREIERCAVFCSGTRQEARFQMIHDLARAKPRNPQVLAEVQERKDRARAKHQADMLKIIDTTIARKEAADVNLSTRDIAELVRESHPAICRMSLRGFPGGARLVNEMGLDGAISRVRSLRVYSKVLFCRGHHRAQFNRESKPDKKSQKGDFYDTDHVVYGSYCDAFVTEETELRRFCGAIQEWQLRCISLADFLQEVDDLRRRCS